MQEQKCLAFGPFRLALCDKRLWCGPAVLPLRPKPFAVLCHLVRQAVLQIRTC
jgi:hypothetical protein